MNGGRCNVCFAFSGKKHKKRLIKMKIVCIFIFHIIKYQFWFHVFFFFKFNQSHAHKSMVLRKKLTIIVRNSTTINHFITNSVEILTVVQSWQFLPIFSNSLANCVCVTCFLLLLFFVCSFELLIIIQFRS